MLSSIYFLINADGADHADRERCSRAHLDAITSDDAGNVYAFRGHHYLRQDVGNDKLHSESIEKAFKELHSEVYAVFSYMDHLYMIKAGTQAHTAQIRR
ncbi:hemopexin-like isoform X2 [Hypomesus transpacificus]|uniref:hemopexin-like isoform X2 n=1 Tax=Hypomesus transpacificus TaxID=137520 RepID=UPI001F086A9F|nr:hemopexin-like isoform X2 [Hypomesus transpacificus]